MDNDVKKAIELLNFDFDIEDIKDISSSIDFLDYSNNFRSIRLMMNHVPNNIDGFIKIEESRNKFKNSNHDLEYRIDVLDKIINDIKSNVNNIKDVVIKLKGKFNELDVYDKDTSNIIFEFVPCYFDSCAILLNNLMNQKNIFNRFVEVSKVIDRNLKMIEDGMKF